MKTTQELMAFNNGNVEAMVKSGQIMANGFQDMTKLMTAAAQSTMDETMATFRALAGVRSIKEAVDLQTSLARSMIEKAVSQTGQVAETSFKVAEQAMAPVASRITVAAESFKSA